MAREPVNSKIDFWLAPPCSQSCAQKCADHVNVVLRTGEIVMLEPQNDSSLTVGRTLRRGSAQLVVIHCAVLLGLVGLAISANASSALISDAVQAEFVASNMATSAPMQLARPAVMARTEREN